MSIDCIFNDIHYTLLTALLIKLKTNNTKKMKNTIFAIPAAPAAIPPNPKTPAIRATTKKMTAKRNIILNFWNPQFDPRIS